MTESQKSYIWRNRLNLGFDFSPEEKNYKILGFSDFCILTLWVFIVPKQI